MSDKTFICENCGATITPTPILPREDGSLRTGTCDKCGHLFVFYNLFMDKRTGRMMTPRDYEALVKHAKENKQE